MHIAICDDDPIELAHISSLLNLYNNDRNANITYKTYTSATELLSDIKRNKYTLLILDILMPGFTGIQAAHEIRTFDSSVKIIFLTSSPEFALDSYSVKAQDYILKPILKDKLFSAINIALAEEQESFDRFSVKTQIGMARILFSRLVFVEVINKWLYFYMSDGSVREVHAPLSEYEEKLLSRQGFIKVHRSYIVNLWHMGELTSNSFVTQTGQTIPISRLLYSSVRQAYMEHLFIETGANK